MYLYKTFLQNLLFLQKKLIYTYYIFLLKRVLNDFPINDVSVNNISVKKLHFRIKSVFILQFGLFTITIRGTNVYRSEVFFSLHLCRLLETNYKKCM